MVKKFDRSSVQTCNRQQLRNFVKKFWCKFHPVICANAFFLTEDAIAMMFLERKFTLHKK